MYLTLILCVLASLSANVAAATLPACKPSRDCALDRAQQLVLQQLAPNPAPGRNATTPSPAAVQLLSTLMRSDPKEYRSGFTRKVLQRLAAAGQEALLEELARALIAQQQDVTALTAIIDIRDLAKRDALYQEMAFGHVDARRFELAYWAAGHMRESTERERLLLGIADRQVQAGQALGAGQTAATLFERAREGADLRQEALRIQAEAAAQLGDARRALELAMQIETPELSGKALSSIAELQIKRNARADALATVRFHREQLRRGAASAAATEIAERLSLLGASTEALQLVRGSELQQARLLAAIAMGAACDQRFPEALATLERISAEERAAVRNAAAFVAQQRAIAGVDFATAFDAASAFSPLPPRERSRWVRNTALLLVQMDNLPRARDALIYEVESILQEPECLEDCPPSTEPRAATNRCDFDARDGALCEVATLQARFGFIEDADRTSTALRSEHALIRVLLAIAQAQIAAGRPVLARRTFMRTLLLARLPPNNQHLDGTLKAYASWVANARNQYDALAELYAATRELIRIDANTACRPDGAPLAVVTAYASAGLFDTAFAMTETQLQCQRVTAYLSIYERGQP